MAGIVASAAVISQCAAKQEGNRLRGPDVVERILVPSCLPKAGEYVTVIFMNSGPRAATKFKANL